MWVVLSVVVPSPFFERYDIVLCGVDREDKVRAIEMGAARLRPNYSKGSEAGWKFQVYDVASVIFSYSIAGSFIFHRSTTIKNHYISREKCHTHPE